MPTVTNTTGQCVSYKVQETNETEQLCSGTHASVVMREANKDVPEVGIRPVLWAPVFSAGEEGGGWDKHWSPGCWLLTRGCRRAPCLCFVHFSQCGVFRNKKF